jgi:RNA polymerase sigma-70 factor (family 1)
MEPKDFRDLVIRIKTSDHEAFEKIFNHFHQTIYQFLLYKIKDADTAEDLLQEVFLKIWKGRTALDENQSLKNYLYTIADNLVLNHFRHQKVVLRHQQESELKIFSGSDSPQNILEEKEWSKILMSAIESLPEQTRTIFLMSRVEDLTYQEIAERLSISLKAVEGHIVKALKTLRTALPFKL